MFSFFSMAHNRMRRAGACALLLALLAGSAQADTSLQAFKAARQKWQAAGLHDYAFTFFNSCYCIGMQPIRITVQAGQVVSATNLRDGTAVQAAEVGQPLGINEIFRKIEEAYAKPADRITLVLNPAYGYPERVFIDYYTMMADEELRYEISDFSR